MASYHVWQPIDIRLRAILPIKRPLEPTVVVTFRGPRDREIVLPAFWDGEQSWVVRFAPTAPGTWRWQSGCLGEIDPSLIRAGVLDVALYRGDNPVYRHGFVRTREGARYMMRADGTPFLWWGDTCWAAMLKASADDWREYVARRVAQRFNLAQTVLFFHSGWHKKDNGPVFAEGKGYRVPNPAFFRDLDQKIAHANANGMTVALVLLWHTATPWSWMPNLTYDGAKLSQVQAVALARYAVARYAAYDVVWLMTGDGVGHMPGVRFPSLLPEGIAYNNAMGRAVADLDPYGHPLGTHPRGHHGTGEHYAGEAWPNHLMYQVAPNPEDSLRQAANYGLARQERLWPGARPVISGEPTYESSDDTYLSDYGVRRSALWSILGGAAGFTYGAYQVFKWWRGALEPGDPPFWAHQDDPAVTWRDQLSLPGAGQLGGIRGWLEALPWWACEPACDLVAQPDDDPLHHVVAVRVAPGGPGAQDGVSRRLACYSPECMPIILVPEACPWLGGDVRVEWVVPATGDRYLGTLQAAGARLRCTPPTGVSRDWLLEIRCLAQEA